MGVKFESEVINEYEEGEDTMYEVMIRPVV